MVWFIFSALMGILTDIGLKKHLKLQRFPITIILSLLSCAIITTAFDDPLRIIKGYLFTQTLIIAGYLDFKTREISNVLLIPAALCGLIDFHPISSIEGAALVFAIMLVSTLIYDGLIGGGDIKLMTACGFTLGLWGAWRAATIAFLLSFLSVLIFRRTKGTRYPLAPYLGIGCFIAYLLN